MSNSINKEIFSSKFLHLVHLIDMKVTTNMITANMGILFDVKIYLVQKTLALANIEKISKNKNIPLRSKAHANQMQTYLQLIEQLGVFQDRKNELDRKDKLSNLNLIKKLLIHINLL